jgi:GntR family transcriptional regulator of arabinose operon
MVIVGPPPSKRSFRLIKFPFCIDTTEVWFNTKHMDGQHVLTSKYQSIVGWIKNEVQSGSFKPGDKLPSESELCDRFDVSRSAVRQALSTLVHEGWLESRKGIGTFCMGRRGSDTSDLALVCYFAASYIFPGIVTAFERTAQRNGFHMIFNQSESDLDREKAILRKLRDKVVGGIAIIPVNPGLNEPGIPSDFGDTNYELLGELVDTGTRILLIDNNFGDDRFPFITLDDEAVGRVAAQYLHDRGHRDIGIIYATNHRPFKLRKEGFSRTLASLGLEGRVAEVGVERTSDAEDTLCDILTTDHPSAFFCANDELAVALYKAAAKCGISIPGDLSVISVDNSEYAQLPGIDLTSISHPSDFIGAKSAQILIDGIASPDVHFKNMIIIDPVIVERTSVRSIR